jgi:hypothetical protein
VCVERFSWNAQYVARRLGEQQLFAGSVGERSPQLREIDVQDRVDRPRSCTTPELFDQSLAWDRLVRMKQENAEERALFRATERKYLLASDDLQLSEDAELEIRSRLRESMVRLLFCEYEQIRVRLLDVFDAYSCRFLRGSIVVACAFSGASIPQAVRFFCACSWRSSSCRTQPPTRLRAS